MKTKAKVDEEIIATFMESKPERTPKKGKPDYGCGISANTWWIYALPGQWEPRDFTLDALWEVEERLADAQCSQYDRELYSAMLHTKPKPRTWYPWHATAAQKIKALAAILRPEVERG